MRTGGSRTKIQQWWESGYKPVGPWQMRLIGNFTFIPHDTRHAMTFKIDGDVHTDGVVVSFLTNWGDEERTCIYRIRANAPVAV